MACVLTWWLSTSRISARSSIVSTARSGRPNDTRGGQRGTFRRRGESGSSLVQENIRGESRPPVQCAPDLCERAFGHANLSPDLHGGCPTDHVAPFNGEIVR